MLCPCWKPAIYHRFVDTLSRCDLFSWLISEKNRVLFAVFCDKISSIARRAVKVYSTRSIALLLASFHIALPNELENPSWIDWTIEIFPRCADFCLVCSPRACRVFERANTQPIVRDDPWHHIDLLCIRALTSARAFAAATCHAGPRARRHRTLNLLTAREAMGLSSRRWLILLASLVPKHNSRFWVSAAQSADSADQLTFMKHLVEIKSQFPCGILFLRLAQK